MEKSLNICAVIVTYNTGKEITTAAESVRSKVDELVIVDNGSDSETVKQLKGLQYENKATVIYLDENKGIAKALNVAAQYALDNGYKWLLTLDDDSRVTENMITTMLQAYDGLEDSEKEKVAVIAPRHIEKGSSEYQEANKKEIELTRVLTEITSGNLVRLELLREAGYYKEEFFIDFVDHYFCLKLKRLGFDIIRVENAILLHSLGNSIPKSILGQKITVTNHSP
ncbi:MAG: glycosyltransferase, partial [Bacillota bacterium]|nr:glycosyltransferase [Bacillota bacterium]